MTSNAGGRRVSGLGLCWLLGVASLVGYQGGTAAEVPGNPPARPALQILWDRPLPAELGPALDVRWASDNSVFLALQHKGVVEVSLEPFGKRVREMIPGVAKSGGIRTVMNLAVSPRFLVASAPVHTVTWQSIVPTLRREVNDFDAIDDLDVFGDRLCVLAARRDDEGNFAPEGAIAWLGSLAEDLKDLKPVVFDQQGPGAPTMSSCGAIGLGTVRFLQDGSLVVVPGFQPGVYFLDGSGRLQKVVDTATLGLDTDCRGPIPKNVITQWDLNLQARYAWLNQHKTVDAILSLPEGPGFLVRQRTKSGIVWLLKVPLVTGGVEEIAVPLAPQSEYVNIQADLRRRRLILLVKTLDVLRLRYADSRLVALELRLAPRANN